MSAVKSRREQYSDATRAALIDAATKRFATDGFTATGLEDIATDIQATRGAVYHHFSNKKALFEAVLHELESESTKRVEAAYTAAADPWSGAIAALDAYLDFCLDPVYSRVAWREGPIALGWASWLALEQEHAYGVIETILRALVDRGLLGPVPLATTTRVIFSVIGAAGVGLAEADAAEQPRLRAEYGEVMLRMITGLRPG
ncbi:TetR/AcrR family transcriptional regulator [Actinokineospora iranica]|uniref:DNA-binding transcriptional regulator, AcrR family n=1 Tax=Actinokineospora iranica TaxID=1271860 RepID=A0A1G6YPE5_9PSEU|nr:TetR/AcrR family transcriptional regulator [Actinokineospora iranica]SDD91547.1 DNA-binding transcriptional regulator, AcrR family [Actinokineospora iranica]